MIQYTWHLHSSLEFEIGHTLKKRFWTTGASTFDKIEYKTTELSTYITAPTDTAAGSAPLDAGSTRLPSAHDGSAKPDSWKRVNWWWDGGSSVPLHGRC